MRKAQGRTGKKMVYRRHKKVKKNGEDEDRISRLPEEILAKVVSFLPFREAVATSVVCRQWRSVWRFSGDFNLDGDDTIKLMVMDNSYFDFEKLTRARCRFIERVNSVINQHMGYIHRFRIYFDLDRSYTSRIDGWIKRAMEGRVEVLELEFLDQGFPRHEEAYILKREVFGEANNNREWFSYIKVLDLKSITVGGDVMEYLLSKCPNLEELHVNMSPKVVDLRIHGPSLALKHLTIYNCQHIEKVEIIDANNLISFYFEWRLLEMWPPNLVIKNVPMLVDVYLHISHLGIEYCLPFVFDMLSSCISQLHILQFSNYLNTYTYPMLPNLKQLKLILLQLDHLNLLNVIHFMEVCPNLNTLVLKMGCLKRGRGRLRKLARPTTCPDNLRSLKELQVIGYNSTDFELVSYFIENAVSLEKIVINPCIYMGEWEYRVPNYPDIIEDEQLARDHALKHLKSKVSSNTAFICL